jgi:hypothetical protein
MLKPRWEEVVRPHNLLPYLKNVSVLSEEVLEISWLHDVHQVRDDAAI